MVSNRRLKLDWADPATLESPLQQTTNLRSVHTLVSAGRVNQAGWPTILKVY
jgi:hypothetical protein